MNTIESRLAAVERQLRFHRAVILGLVIALAALVSLGAGGRNLFDEQPDVLEVVRARRFEAINKQGKMVMFAGAASWGNGQVDIYDEAGNARLVLSGWDTGGIDLRNRNGGSSVVVGTEDDGAGFVRVYDRRGRTTTPGG
ncbi:MAG: hypothetical protein HY342_10120 [Candidatus Lambdaproteobacteria bacterium]|nr:hypothetical protein [Candidatus Lambdaproteobacteria bacterium]